MSGSCSRIGWSISRATLVSILAILGGCAADDVLGDRPGDDWRQLFEGDGLAADGSRQPTTLGTAAFFVSAADRVYRFDGQAPPLPASITSIPGSRGSGGSPELAEAADEDLSHSSIIFGADNRVPYTSTSTLTSYNKRTIGLLNTAVGQCTGSLIGPRHVLTSAHCVLTPLGGFSSAGAITFSPGRRGGGFGTTTPNGPPRTAVGYYTRTNNDTWDYALIILTDQASTASLGWMGLRWSTSDSWYESLTVSLVGYPGATQLCWNAPGGFGFCNGFQYGESCPIDWADEDLEYECDTQTGQSGSPVYGWFYGMPDVVGVHRGSTLTPFNDWNKAVRLSAVKVVDLCLWMTANPSAFASRPCP